MSSVVVSKTAPRTCHYCPKDHDLRPYGPGGALVCFQCAMATPERKAETDRNFGDMLTGAGPTSVLTEDGPQPYADVALPGGGRDA